MTTELSKADEEFLARCEEKFKDRFTERDEEYMKTFTAEPSIPPILENWWVRNNAGRYDRRHNRKPYQRHDNASNSYNGRDNFKSGYSRGYNDYNNDSYNNHYSRRNHNSH
ncbi:unnamed protein product [Leptidea sinapis]|uniref:Uncharacterized protein n=1 Tax=Leptidea sinapis TaxID=189913 RepID=A0A5E4PPQ2_9NEOP|nr:unnamed protein product [Leptidea sinapis]